MKYDDLKEPQASNIEWLQNELREARGTIRTLLRQIKKEQDRHAEISRAYSKTVENLVEAMRENTELARECELLRGRIQHAQMMPEAQLQRLPLELSMTELAAIRKAMARLHHPDAGGDSERMKLWNAVLDKMELEHSKGSSSRKPQPS
jgi:hypothetical protein